ncbi:MAG: hypothetical protein AB1324_07895 [Candidatus Micrarchaeota archaeon]
MAEGLGSRALIVVLMLLLLPGAASAQGLESDFKILVPIVAGIVIAGLAMSVMLANSISNPQLEAWSKTEIREFVAGIILIAILLGLFFGANGVAVALTGQQTFVAASQVITESWSDNVINAYDDIIFAATKIRAGASYSSGTNIPIYWVSLSYQTGPLGGASIFLVPLSLATQGLTNAIFLIEALRFLVLYIDTVMPTVLLPISLCIRLIPFTRKLGNTLISICVAAMVFFPVSIVLADVLNQQINPPLPNIDDFGPFDAILVPVYTFAPLCEFKVIRFLFSMTDPLFSAVVCLPIAWIPGAFPVCFNLVWQVIYPIMSMVFQILNALTMIIWEAAQNPGNYGGSIYDGLKPFLTNLSNYVMVIYLDVVFVGILTMSGARSLSAALGGEWYMAGVQRLI